MKARSLGTFLDQRLRDVDIRSRAGESLTKRSEKKNIITFSWAEVGVQSDEVSIRAAAEAAVARSMCLPIVINSALAGPALIDQGATRSVMRLSAYRKN